MAAAAFFPKTQIASAAKLLEDPFRCHVSSRRCLWAFPAISNNYFLRTGDRMQVALQQHRMAPLCRAESQDESSSPNFRSAVEERPTEVLEDEDDAELEVRDNDAENPASTGVTRWLFPPKEELPDEVEMSLFDHLDELRNRIIVSVAVVGVAILGCFAFAKDLIVFLEAPVYSQGVRFLQLSPGEYFFTTIKVSGYSGLLLGSPVILYEIIAFVLPGLTRSERKFLGPIVLGSSVLFYTGLAFSYKVLAPAALNFFVSYAEGAVESLWSIDQYFEFVLVLLFSTGLAFQVRYLTC
ncbi:hypothetical protein L7F22_037621 [Adiantum nelumboides]|nr:hypothetical protein [Adiantum nelumboides]